MTTKNHTTEPLETGFLRLPDVLRLFPVSKTSWYRGIESGLYPEPVQLASRTVAWRTEDIRALIERTNNAVKPKFIRKKEVLSLTGLTSSGLYNLIQRGLFPSQITLAGGKAVAWLESDVLQWQADCLANQSTIASK